jgi:putative methionine-R-sulfoxide reductase with GAF domain
MGIKSPGRTSATLAGHRRTRKIVTEQSKKPVLDEQTFEKLLEATYVLQEHNRKRRELEENLEWQSEQLREQELANQALVQQSKPESRESEESARAKSDYTLTLAQIVEAQRQIQMRHLDLDKALAVVAERVTRITSASGAAIGILDGATVRYRAGAGPPALPLGSEVSLQTAVCQANVRTGQVIRTEEMDTEFLFDPEPCRQRGIQSLIAVPIHYDGNIVGALELYFDKIHGFAEQDIHTCQLMAGLVTEAIGRDAELKLKKSMAAERTTMLATIERLKPSLTALAERRSNSTASTGVGTGVAPALKSPCWKCGTQLIAEEQFCGTCGAARATDSEPPSMQSKLAAAWHSQQMARETAAAAAPPNGTPPLAAKRAALSEGDWNQVQSEEETVAEEEAGNEKNVDALSPVIVKPRRQDMAIWSSAQKAQDFLESLSATHKPSALSRFWRSRRGDFYLGVALILVVAVIRWGIWSDHSVVATGRGTTSGRVAPKRSTPDADLSAFDKLLIGLGLAEAPDEPVQDKGNPDTQVWVDLNTALYYCPGSDLYGKTPKGKLSSQRDAQFDQFEPANRKACD